MKPDNKNNRMLLRWVCAWIAIQWGVIAIALVCFKLSDGSVLGFASASIMSAAWCTIVYLLVALPWADSDF